VKKEKYKRPGCIKRGCNNVRLARKLCSSHYYKQRNAKRALAKAEKITAMTTGFSNPPVKKGPTTACFVVDLNTGALLPIKYIHDGLALVTRTIA